MEVDDVSNNINPHEEETESESATLVEVEEPGIEESVVNVGQSFEEMDDVEFEEEECKSQDGLDSVSEDQPEPSSSFDDNYSEVNRSSIDVEEEVDGENDSISCSTATGHEEVYGTDARKDDAERHAPVIFRNETISDSEEEEDSETDTAESESDEDEMVNETEDSITEHIQQVNEDLPEIVEKPVLSNETISDSEDDLNENETEYVGDEADVIENKDLGTSEDNSKFNEGLPGITSDESFSKSDDLSDSEHEDNDSDSESDEDDYEEKKLSVKAAFNGEMTYEDIPGAKVPETGNSKEMLSHESSSDSDSDEEEEVDPKEVSVGDAAVRDEFNVVEAKAKSTGIPNNDGDLESIRIDDSDSESDFETEDNASNMSDNSQTKSQEIILKKSNVYSDSESDFESNGVEKKESPLLETSATPSISLSDDSEEEEESEGNGHPSSNNVETPSESLEIKPIEEAIVGVNLLPELNDDDTESEEEDYDVVDYDV